MRIQLDFQWFGDIISLEAHSVALSAIFLILDATLQLESAP
jgi:hypothetical protein